MVVVNEAQPVDPMDAYRHDVLRQLEDSGVGKATREKVNVAMQATQSAFQSFALGTRMACRDGRTAIRVERLEDKFPVWSVTDLSGVVSVDESPRLQPESDWVEYSIPSFE